MEGQSIRVQCSPKTFQRIQEDDMYRDEMLQHLTETGNDFENVVLEEVPIAENLIDEEAEVLADEEDAGFSGAAKDLWLEAPTLLLLSLVAEMLPKVGKTFQLKNKNRMWQMIQDRLADKGHYFTVLQVQGKFRSLERSFKQVKLNNSKTGRARKTCKYESELEKILGMKRGVHPEFVIDSDELQGTSREELVARAGCSSDTAATTSGDECLSTAPPKKLKKTSTVQEKLLEKMTELVDVKKQFYEQFIEEEKEKNRIERERNDILRKLIEKNN